MQVMDKETWYESLSGIEKCLLVNICQSLHKLTQLPPQFWLTQIRLAVAVGPVCKLSKEDLPNEQI